MRSPGNIAENGILAFTKHVLFPLRSGADFVIRRKEEFGGDMIFKTYQELEDAFAKEDVHPGDLKNAVGGYLNELLEPIRQEFDTPENKNLTMQAYPPPVKQKGPKKKGGGAAAAGGVGPATDELVPSRLDLRVGKIVSVEKHPDADSLYVETVDLGEEKTRTVVSGLAGLVPMEALNGRIGVFLCNLKPQKMRGIESQAMLMCASSADPRAVEPLNVPEGCKPGDKVFFEGHDAGTPDTELKPKKKVWDSLQVDMKTNDECVALWKDNSMLTAAGPIKCSSLAGAPIK